MLRLYQGKLRYFAKHHGTGSRRALLRAIRCVTGLKVAAYTALRWLSLGRFQRDGLWRAVAAGLTEMPP